MLQGTRGSLWRWEIVPGGREPHSPRRAARQETLGRFCKEGRVCKRTLAGTEAPHHSILKTQRKCFCSVDSVQLVSLNERGVE